MPTNRAVAMHRHKSQPGLAAVSMHTVVSGLFRPCTDCITSVVYDESQYMCRMTKGQSFAHDEWSNAEFAEFADTVSLCQLAGTELRLLLSDLNDRFI